MFPVEPGWSRIVSGGSYTPVADFTSVRGAVTLAEGLDVSEWSESATSDNRKVTSRLSLTVADPRADIADGPDAPLGWMGQRIIASAGFAHRGRELRVPMGQWRIDDPGTEPARWAEYGTMLVQRGTVASPTGADLLSLLEDDLPWLTGPRAGGTVWSEVVRLVEDRIPIADTWAGLEPLTSVPASVVYEQDRLTAICDLLATIGAVAWVNRAGALEPRPAVPIEVAWDVPATAVVRPLMMGGREGLFNRVIVTGSDDDGTEMRAVASETEGPFSVTGSFGVSTKTYSNPLAKTQGALDATARTYLRQGIEGRAVRWLIDLAVPNYALDPLDLVRVTLPDGRRVTGPVVGLTRGPSSMQVEIPAKYTEVWPDAVAL